MKFTYILMIWTPSMLLSIALMTIGTVQLASFAERAVTRVSNPDLFNDTALVIDLGTGDISLRECNGSVAYRCNGCASTAEPSVGQAPKPIIIINHSEAAAGEFRRGAKTLARKHPDDICTDDGMCGATLKFEECADVSHVIESCVKLRDIAKPLAHYTLIGGIFDLLCFVLVMASLGWLCCEKYEDDIDSNPRFWGALGISSFFSIVFGVIASVFGGLAARKKNEFMECRNCCPGSAGGIDSENWNQSLLDRGFSFEAGGIYWASLACGITFALPALVHVIIAIFHNPADTNTVHEGTEPHLPPQPAAVLAAAAITASGGTATGGSEMMYPPAQQTQQQHMFFPSWEGAEDGVEIASSDAAAPAAGKVVSTYEDNHQYCAGDHAPFSAASSIDCMSIPCRISGRRVCAISCSSCPSAYGLNNAHSESLPRNHSRCRGQHECYEPACMGRPVCVSGCHSCPDAHS